MTDELETDLNAVWESLETQEDTRARDERGRFAAKAAEEAEIETPAVELAPALEEITDQGNEPPAEPAEQPLSPPERWSADMKAKFTTLPREAQQLHLDRESEYDKAFTQKSQEAAKLKHYEPLEPILASRRQQWAQEGMSQEQAISQLLQLSDFAGSKPREFVEWFKQQHGIVDSQPTAQPQDGTAAPDLTPHLAPLVTKIQSIEQQLNNERLAATQSVIDAFRQDPAHPHFADVEQDMLAMLPSVKAANPGLPHQELLKKAYDKAVWANETVRERTLADQRASQEAARVAQEAKRLEEQKAAALKARKAAGTQLSTTASLNGGQAAPTSEQELMESVWSKMTGTS